MTSLPMTFLIILLIINASAVVVVVFALWGAHLPWCLRIDLILVLIVESNLTL